MSRTPYDPMNHSAQSLDSIAESLERIADALDHMREVKAEEPLIKAAEAVADAWGDGAPPISYPILMERLRDQLARYNVRQAGG